MPDFLSFISEILWGSVMIYLLLGCGIWFTWRTGYIQHGSRSSFVWVLAPVARGSFFLLVKWLALRAGQRQSWFFSLSWFSRWWRGAGFLFWSNGFALRAGQR